VKQVTIKTISTEVKKMPFSKLQGNSLEIEEKITRIGKTKHKQEWVSSLKSIIVEITLHAKSK